MVEHKTIKAALATVTADTICTCCNKPASAGYLNVQGGEGCVAMVHDRYSQGFRATLISKWGRRPRIIGVEGSGLLDMKRRNRK